METLARYAERILETARQMPGADWTVLITRAGQTQMLADNDWPLESLLRERGAAMAFRVTRGRTGVAVEGQSQQSRCRLEALTPEWAGGRPAGKPQLLPGPWG